MSLNIDISSNIAYHMKNIDNLNKQVFYQSIRHSIGKALGAGQTRATKSLRERLNLGKAKDVKKRIRITKPKASSLANLEGIISFDDAPQPLLDFVKGSKNRIEQKGLTYRKRRVLKIEITKGKVFKMKGGFIQKVKSTQVFRRGKGGGFYKQSAPSIAHFIEQEKLKIPVIRRMKDVFRTNLKNQYEYRLARMAAKSGRNWNAYKKI